MGYHVEMDFRNVVIPADKVPACLDAINNMFIDENLKFGSGGRSGPDITEDTPIKEKIWYSWVTTPKDGKFKTLEDAIEEWRYGCCGLDDESIEISYFEGEKLGDDNMFMLAIAPFVEAGAYVNCQGEDGCLWRWAFDGKEMKELSGTVTYE